MPILTDNTKQKSQLTFVVVETRNGNMLHPVGVRRFMPQFTLEYFGIVRAFRLNWPGPVTRATFKSRAHGPSLDRVLFSVFVAVVLLVVDLLERVTLTAAAALVAAAPAPLSSVLH